MKNKLTIDDITSVIIKDEYLSFEETNLTICVLTLKNGYTVTGESSCLSKDNFDINIGRKISKENAINKIWMLEGYLLKEKMSQQ